MSPQAPLLPCPTRPQGDLAEVCAPHHLNLGLLPWSALAGEWRVATGSPGAGMRPWRQAVRPGLENRLPFIRQLPTREVSDLWPQRPRPPTPDPLLRAARAVCHVARARAPAATCYLRLTHATPALQTSLYVLLRACWARSGLAWPVDAASTPARRSPRAGGALSGKYLPYGTQPAGARLTLFPERYARFTTQRVSMCGGEGQCWMNRLDTVVCY